MPKKKTLLLIDAMNLIYKGHFAFIRDPLRTSDGFVTSAIFSFGKMLYKVMKDWEPDNIGVAFEGREKGRRFKEFEAYKANRPPMPDDLRAQIDPITEMICEMGIPLLQDDCAEADDIIATLARKGEAAGLHVYILSTDKDLMQLVSDDVTMLRPMRGRGVSDVEEVDAAYVEEKMGVPPALVHDFLALVGDSSDNIPGVKTVGPKKALKLLNDFGDFDGIYANLESVQPDSVRKALIDCKDAAYLSYDLVRLDYDLRFDVTQNDLVPMEPDEEALREFFEQYDLRMFLKELKTKTSKKKEVEEEGEEEVEQEVNEITPVQLYSKLRACDGDNVAITIEGERAVFAIGKVVVAVEISIVLIDILVKAGDNLNVRLLTHNSKEAAKRFGDKVIFDFDTKLAAYLLNPIRNSYSIKALTLGFLRYDLPASDVSADGAFDFGESNLQTAAHRVQAIAELVPILRRRLNEEKMTPLLDTIELPLAPVLANLETTGIGLDTAVLKELNAEIETNKLKLEQEIYEIAGREFNINSPKQLEVVLFDEIGLKSLRKTKTGRSTAAPVLEKLAKEHPLPAKVIEFRQLAKFQGTYVEALPRLVNINTGRIHTTFHQVGVSTGRLSSSDPNLQNIPIRTELGARIREAFVPAEGMLFLSADYSQVELRILAAMGPVESLVRAFEEGRDIHAFTASEIFGCAEDEVDTEQRSLAKSINYGIAYGMGPRNLAEQAGLSVDEGKKYIETYFERYPGVKGYMERMKQKASDDGYVETYFGRRRYLPDINSSNKQMAAAMERAAINAPIQGTAADVMKMGLIEAYRRLRESDIDAELLLTIHDELLFEVAPADVESLTELATTAMSDVVDLGVSLKVNVGVGANWREAHG